MNQELWFDVIAIAIILFLGIKGIINGFVKELFGLFGLVGGIYFASRYAQKVGDLVDANLLQLDNKSSLYLIGFIVILIGFWIICLILGYIFAKLINLSGLGGVDRILGFIAGSGKFFLIFSIIIAIISNIDFVSAKIKPYVEKSITYPIFYEIGNKIIHIDTKKLKKEVKNIKIEQNDSQNLPLNDKIQNNLDMNLVISELNSTKKD